MTRPALGLVALLAWPAGAAAQPCEGRYPRAEVFTPALLGRPAPSPIGRLWGRENIAGIPGDPAGLRLRYPAGSINPGHPTAPMGGAGFAWTVPPAAGARCLSYRVRFGEGFDFARGGKLPGLFGGDAPTGCSPAELSRGFSARLMWRQGGIGELYLYAPDRAARCGESIGRGTWRFTPGRWTEVAQEVVLNRPSQADGVIRIWIDGQRVLERGGLVLRQDPSVRIDGLLFSSFFGGADRSWASPRDQQADFTALTIGD